MNERFLFQGKRKDNGEWVYGYYIFYDTDVPGHGIFQPDQERDEAFHFVAPATIGQCTGLRAAKSYRGEKPEDLLIFEGDMLRFTNHGVAVVEWIPYSWNVKWISGHYQGGVGLLSHYSNEEIEIIGTIHDEPQEVKR